MLILLGRYSGSAGGGCIASSTASKTGSRGVEYVLSGADMSVSSHLKGFSTASKTGSRGVEYDLSGAGMSVLKGGSTASVVAARVKSA